MIIYYNHKTGDITGISHIVDSSRTDNWFETADPIAVKIFTGEEKLLRYKVEFSREIDGSKPMLVSKISTSTMVHNSRDKIILVPYGTKDAEINIIQRVKNKTVDLKFSSIAKEIWIDSNAYKTKSCFMIACPGVDPYFPLWSMSTSLDDVEVDKHIKYSGKDSIRFFTNMKFRSISHVIVYD